MDLPFFSERVGLPDKLGFGGLVGAGGVTGASIAGGEQEEQYQPLEAQVLNHLQQEQEEVEVLEIPVQHQKVRAGGEGGTSSRLGASTGGGGAGGRSDVSSVSPKEGGGGKSSEWIEPHLGELGEGGICSSLGAAS